ncbi:MAG TPA: hypothetical protein VG166_07580 [Caulobacteraceae bacterium]|jgi:capsular polysaccharide transport system permease protein|nr:hypothetical protein [Caulobacteraceae bacterium]
MYLTAFKNQLRVLGAMLLREAGIKHGKSLAFGFLTDAVEPLLIIASVCTLRSLLDAHARFGTSIVLFIGTGVFPVFMFIRTTMHIRAPIGSSKSPKFPIETTFDRVVVYATLHMVASTIVAIFFFSVLFAWGNDQAMPYDLWNAIISMLVLFGFGIGVGMANSVIGEFIPLWASLWAGLSRVMLHFSGIYFVADFLPPSSRRFFMVNPVLHGVSWFRHSFFPMYPNVINDHRYLVVSALVALVIGMALEQVLHKHHARGH